MSRVDILTLEQKYYTFENDSARKIQKAFAELGVPTKLISLLDGHLQDYLLYIQKDPPLWTLSFRDLLNKRTPLCEILRIPHFFWGRGSLSSGVYYLDARYGHVRIIDRALSMDPRLVFFPPPVEMHPLNEGHRPFDVVLFSPLIEVENKKKTWKELFLPEGAALLEEQVAYCQKNPSILIDGENKKKTWNELFPSEGAALIEERVAYCQKNPSISPTKAVLEKRKDGAICAKDFLMGVEEYLKAEEIRNLITSFTDARLDVFGEHVGNNWLKRLQNRDWIYLHGELPYTEYFEVLKEAKILLIHHMESFDGVDEWFFAALANGALPIVNPTPYLKEILGENSPIYYNSRNWKEMLARVHFFLAHPEERDHLVLKLRAVLPPYSWACSAEHLLKHMDKVCHAP